MATFSAIYFSETGLHYAALFLMNGLQLWKGRQF